MKKQHKRSTRDTHEIVQNEHNEALNARRVMLVGGGDISLDVDTSTITESISKALKGIKLDTPAATAPSIGPEIKIVEVPVQVFVPQVETKIIEVPVQTIVTEYKVVEIEKPVVTEVLKTIELVKPVIVEKTVERVPMSVIALLTGQTLIIAGLAWSILTKQWGL